MAGVSIELRKLLKGTGIFNIISAGGYSALLSSGNWLIAVSSIFLISTFLGKYLENSSITVIFQVYITYAIALSLILSGPFQLAFTRYSADMIFEGKADKILPNFLSSILLCILISFFISLPICIYLLEGKDIYHWLIFSITIATLSGVWFTNSLLTGLKSYKYVLFSFILSYSLCGLLIFFGPTKELYWLILSFYISQSLLLLLLVLKIINDFHSDGFVSFEFFKNSNSYLPFFISGLFYNLGIWTDKFIFWFSDITGDRIFANIRFSVIYDVPIILAYISLIPGISIFFIKIEVEFAERYKKYYDAVREWGKLDEIYALGEDMIVSARSIINETLRFQLMVVIILLLIQEKIFKFLNIPLTYLPLFDILLVGSMLQLTFMTIFALLSYFNRKWDMVKFTFIFTTLNASLSLLSQYMGPHFYGYGYTLSLLISVLAGMILIGRFLDEVHYRTFMLGG